MTLFVRFIRQDLLLEREAADGWRPAAINAVDKHDARFAERIIRHDGSLLSRPPTQVDQLTHARLEAVSVLGDVVQVLLPHDDAHAASCKMTQTRSVRRVDVTRRHGCRTRVNESRLRRFVLCATRRDVVEVFWEVSRGPDASFNGVFWMYVWSLDGL